jgi:hypothetical protein
MKKVIEKRSPTHLIPLSVCLSVYSVSPVAAQLAPVRFGNNQKREKACSNKGQRKRSLHLCILGQPQIHDPPAF